MGFYYPRRERDQIALTARGLISESFQLPINPAGTNMTSQRLEGCLLGLRAGDVVTNIVVNVAQAGSGTDPTDIFLGLYSVAGTRLALTADLGADTRWDTTGYKECALTAPYTITEDGGYYPVFLMNGSFGSTALQLWRGVNNGAALGEIGSGAKYAVSQTGQASLPASASFVTASQPFWFGVS